MAGICRPGTHSIRLVDVTCSTLWIVCLHDCMTGERYYGNPELYEDHHIPVPLIMRVHALDRSGRIRSLWPASHKNQ